MFTEEWFWLVPNQMRPINLSFKQFHFPNIHISGCKNNKKSFSGKEMDEQIASYYLSYDSAFTNFMFQLKEKLLELNVVNIVLSIDVFLYIIRYFCT